MIGVTLSFSWKTDVLHFEKDFFRKVQVEVISGVRSVVPVAESWTVRSGSVRNTVFQIELYLTYVSLWFKCGTQRGMAYTRSSAH